MSKVSYIVQRSVPDGQKRWEDFDMPIPTLKDARYVLKKRRSEFWSGSSFRIVKVTCTRKTL